MSNSNNTITVFNNIIVFMLLPEKAEMTIILQKYLKWVLSINYVSKGLWVNELVQLPKPIKWKLKF